MVDIQISVSGETAKCTNADEVILTSGSIGTFSAVFDVDETWNDLTLEGVFVASNAAYLLKENNNTIVRRSNALVSNAATVHEDVMRTAGKTLYIGLTGLDENGAIVRCSTLAVVGKILPGADVDGPGNGDIPETQYQEIKRLIEDFGGATDEQVAAAVASYVEENPIYTDDTLTVSGAAADAQTVGAALATLDASKAPAGYGLGGGATSIIASNVSLDDVVANGWYAFEHNANANCPYPAGTLLVLARSGDGAYAYQIAFLDSAATQSFQVRKRTGGAWGEWEWVNPPMALGTEYRTTERWNDKVVYRKYFSLGSIVAGDNVITGWTALSVHMIRDLKLFGTTGRIMTNADSITSIWADASNGIQITAASNRGTMYAEVAFTVYG